MVSVRFNKAWQIAKQFAADNAANLGTRRILVRDVYGRIRLVVDTGSHEAAKPKIIKNIEEKLAAALKGELAALRASLGPYAPRDFLISSLRLLLPDEVFTDPKRVPLDGVADTWTLDRQISADGWTVNLKSAASANRRAVLFGLKGGVGRSTATALWARHLATLDKKVLVIDLDLEAPGVGSALLAQKDWPNAGLIDWLVEDTVGQGDAVIEDMIGRVVQLEDGEILVVPASGRDEKHYLHKLGRAFTKIPSRTNPAQLEGFALRIRRLLGDLEKRYKPDAVLIDARAGLHDLSAAALVALGGHNFMFAFDSPQTWSGYRHLLRHWNQEHPGWRTFRDRLQFVMGQVPVLGRASYIENFNIKAYELLAEFCYDNIDGGDLADFHPARDEREAPHVGWQIGWSAVFQTYDPIGDSATPKQIEAEFGAFLAAATARLFGDPKQEES